MFAAAGGLKQPRQLEVRDWAAHQCKPLFKCHFFILSPSQYKPTYDITTFQAPCSSYPMKSIFKKTTTKKCVMSVICFEKINIPIHQTPYHHIIYT